MKKIILISIFFICTYIFANTTNVSATDIFTKSEIENIKSRILALDEDFKKNIWTTRHENHVQYEELNQKIETIENEIKRLKLDSRGKINDEKINNLTREKETLLRKIEPLKEYKDLPYLGLLRAPEVAEIPKISNPFALINGFSYIKQLRQDLDSFQKINKELKTLIEQLKDKEYLLEELRYSQETNEIDIQIEEVEKSISEFETAYDITTISSSVYERKVSESINRATLEIKSQIKHAFIILAVIVFIILISFLLKIVFKKYMSDSDNGYIVNKIINIINVTLIILILLFAYIDNMTYMIAILGVASAGIAIAMKDMFMNILGWVVIIFGGSFNVGDRIKVRKDGLSYVGDIIDISLMRMTILEDVTLTTYLENKRAGRVIFVPNNYIFTTLIANYTHSTLKTVWDGLFITITFDSNYKKAMYIIKEITKKYSKGYTEIARKQLNYLRREYNLKNTNVEPKIFSFIEPHGLTLHIWYMTNSYAALSLRSTLSGEIIDAINKESDIVIAYPTQTLNLKQAPKVQMQSNESLES